MRIQRLDLIAFGPFSDVALDFRTPAGQSGLHLVYGANEAGKSSTLRALRAVLFGFPHRTQDNFRHSNSRLRVGATLEAADGRTLSFIRRKAKEPTLYDSDDQIALPNDALLPFLGGIRAEEYFTMFAIGHEELRAGGEAVLKGHGRLGEVIFMASAGLPRLRRIEQSLKKEARDYFLPTGRNPKINDAIPRLGELEQTRKSLSLRPEAFLRCTEDLEQARAELNAVEADRAALRREKSRLDRLSQAIPTAARLRQLRERIEGLGEPPQLSDDFSHRREELVRKARNLDGALGRLRVDLDATVDELERLVVPEELLAAAHEIDQLKERLGSHKKAAMDLEHRRAEAAVLETEIADQLRSIYPDRRLDQIDELRLTRQDRATIRTVASRLETLTTTIQQEERRADRLREQISEAGRALENAGPVPSADRLRQVLREAGRQGDLDGLTAEAEAEAEALGRRIEVGIAALSGWTGTADELLRLPVPSTATIDRFENEFQALDQQRTRLDERRDTAERALRDAERNLQREMHGRDVPSEQALQESRSWRDTGWQEVRRELDGREPGELREAFLDQADGRSLLDAVEHAIRQADDVADRLRHEADRVERVGSLRREAAAHQSERDHVAAAEAERLRQWEEMLRNWKEQWPFLDPLSPREMREWIFQQSELVRLVHEQQAAQARAAELRQRLEEQQVAVSDALKETGSGERPSGMLSAMIDVAEQSLAELDSAAETRRNLLADQERNERDLRDVEQSQESRREELAAIETEWNRWRDRLKLSESTTREGVLVVLETLDEIVNHLTKLHSLQERIAGMQENARTFAADVRAAAARLVPEIQNHPIADAAAALHTRLDEARSIHDRRAGLLQRRTQLNDDLTATTATRAHVEAELAELCRLAGCDDPEELPAIEQRAAEYRRLTSLYEQAEQELCERSGGQPLDQFLAEIDAVDADGIGNDLEQIARRLDDIDPRHKSLVETVTRLTQEHSRMDGGTDSAKIAEDAAALQAQLKADVEQYASLLFAARLLRDGRDRYRQKTGNAVLDRASEQFAILTGGGFTGLTVDREHDDEPLVGIRPNKAEVPVEGMSDGTVDQLYLALRLAGLSSWIESHQPLPVFVDDILIQFDDDRSIAALRALAGLSERTQVVLFTHHRHVVDLARESLADDVLHIHSLDGWDDGESAGGAIGSAQIVS